MTVGDIMSGNMLQLKDIANSTYSAEYLSAVTPLSDGESYAMISKDGRKIVKYSYKTGKQTGVLFDVGNTIGESIDAFDNYIMSPDGTKMLIQTNTKKYIAVHLLPLITFIILQTEGWNGYLIKA